MYQKDLIYDVGMYDGGDTAYYLHKGYRVVSIEANPSWVEEGQGRFAEAIGDGRLTILNLAIGPEEGFADLVVNEKSKDWATLDKEIVPLWGDMPTHTVQVRTVRFKDILAEYGVPFYLKVDIEHFDHYCLADLDPADLPPYVSFEEMKIRDLVTMREKGYDAFKVIRQRDYTQVFFDPNDANAALNRELSDRPTLLKALRAPGMFKYKVGKMVRRKPPALPPITSDWEFRPGSSSGPFGEATDGPWRSFEEVAMTWLAYDRGLISPDIGDTTKWHDIHCRATSLTVPASTGITSAVLRTPRPASE